MRVTSNKFEDTVRSRLLSAAKSCFLSDEYHRVSTRMIAELAGANVSMISYYFGNKEGLYEEMIKEEFSPLLEALETLPIDSLDCFTDFLRLYYHTMSTQPEFPKLILKVLALNQGPGQRFIQQLLERGRKQGNQNVDRLKEQGQVTPMIDFNLLRITFVSLAITPMLLKDIFEEQIGQSMDEAFLDQLASFNGRLFASGITPSEEEKL